MINVLDAKNKPPPNYRRFHLALIFDKNNTLVNFCWNRPKFSCAERLMLKENIPPNSIMIVFQIRMKKLNSTSYTIGNSLPCSLCREKLLSSDIDSVIYSEKGGELTTCNTNMLPENEYSASV